jgi:hypothetical protein
METAVDSKGPELPDGPRPRWEKHVSKLVPPYYREQLLKHLAKQYKQQPDDLAYVKQAAKNLSWMIPATTVEGFSLALFVADILMFAVIVHSILSGAVLLGVAIGMLTLWVKRGIDYPNPSSLGEVIIGALIAMFFSVVTLLLVFQVAPQAVVPLPVLVRFVVTGVVGLTLTGLSFHFPKWNPKKYNEWNCAYYWAFSLNCAWAVAWYAVMDGSPAAGDPARSGNFFSLSSILVAGPILVLFAMAYNRGSKDGINMAKKHDLKSVSLDPRTRQIHDIKRKRVILYTFRGGLGEAVIFGALGANLLVQAFLKPNFDSMRFGVNVAGAFMLVAVWRYIRRANRRADTLLEKRLKAL